MITGRSAAALARNALTGLLWGAFLNLATNLLLLNQSHHAGNILLVPPLLTLAAAFAVFLYAAWPLPLAVAIPVHAAALPVALLIAAHGDAWLRLPAAVAPRLMDLLLGLAVFGLPAFTGAAWAAQMDRPGIVLAGTAAGIMAAACLAPFTGPHILLIALAVPAGAAVFLTRKAPVRVPPEEDLPPIPQAALSIAGIALLAGTAAIMYTVILGFAGLSGPGRAALAATLLAAAAAGAAAARPLSRDRDALMPGLGIAAAGLALPLACMAGRALLAHTALAVAPAGADPTRSIVVPLLVGGAPAFLAGLAFATVFPALMTGRAVRARKRLVLVAAAIIPPFLPAWLGWHSHTAAILACGLTAAATGCLAILATRADRRIPAVLAIIAAGIATGIVAHGPGAFRAPLVMNAKALNLQFRTKANAPAAINAQYRVAAYHEYGGGYYAELTDRRTLQTYLFANGDLFYPDEFLDDDQAPLIQLACLLHPAPARVLYGGPVTPAIAGALSEYFPRSVTVAEEFPGLASGTAATCLPRDLRGVLQTDPGPWDAIINLPAQPGTRAALGRYTREFFAAAAARTAPGGIVVQFLPCYKVTIPFFNGVLAAFTDVFGPGAQVWSFGNYCVLVGTVPPWTPDLAGFCARFERSPRPGPFRRPADILACYITRGSVLADHIVPWQPLHDGGTLAAAAAGDKALFHTYEFINAIAEPFDRLFPGDSAALRPAEYRQARRQYAATRLAWMTGSIDAARAGIKEALRLMPDDGLLADLEHYLAFRVAVRLAQSQHKRFQLEEALKSFEAADVVRDLGATELTEIGEINLELARRAEWPEQVNRARAALGWMARARALRHDAVYASSGAVEALLDLKLVDRAQRELVTLRDADPAFPGLAELERRLAAADASLAPADDPALREIIAAAMAGLFAATDTATVNTQAACLVTAGFTSLPPLVGAFAGAGETGQRRIIHMLTRLGGDPALAATRTIMQSDAPDAIKLECFDLLRIYGDRTDTALIGPFTRPAYPAPIRARAVIALARMEHPAAIPWLIDALADPEPAVRSEALEALQSAHAAFAGLDAAAVTTADLTRLAVAFAALPADLRWPPFPGEAPLSPSTGGRP
ncbi:MAG: HEAT repeat domain-containing protein [Planctomycetota bacterium]